MKSNEELTEIYLRHIGYIRKDGVSLEVLEPFFLIDLCYSMFNSVIKPIECKHEINRIKKAWRNELSSFFNKFFRAFDDETQGEVVDKMDYFEDYMSEEVNNLRAAIWGEFQEESEKNRELISVAVSCQILAAYANIIRSRIFAKVKPLEYVYIHNQKIYCKQDLDSSPDPQISRMEELPIQWVALYCPPKRDVKIDECEKVNEAVRKVENRIVQFLCDDVNARKNEERRGNNI